MRFYVAFDDTDTLDCGRGTGKLARWFADVLPPECTMWAVIRQQLLHSPEIPMTSHNSSLCCVVDAPDESYRSIFIEKGIAHIKNFFVEGSDPGLCVALETDPEMAQMVQFGLTCTHKKVTQAEAFAVAKSVHLSGHGGTNDGIIGALAAVGLTYLGASGRVVDYGDLRKLPQVTSVGELRQRKIEVLSVNRHAEYIPNHHLVDNQGSLRPRLWQGSLVIPVLSNGHESWITIVDKKEYDNSIE